MKPKQKVLLMLLSTEKIGGRTVNINSGRNKC